MDKNVFTQCKKWEELLLYADHGFVNWSNSSVKDHIHSPHQYRGLIASPGISTMGLTLIPENDMCKDVCLIGIYHLFKIQATHKKGK